MRTAAVKKYQSHGRGTFRRADFRSIGNDVVLEKGILVFNPRNITIGDNVYIGHYTILKGYHQNLMAIGDNTWIGQGCFFHSAGGIDIGRAVGIGPGVRILTSVHHEDDPQLPILYHPLTFKHVRIGDGSDLGVGSIILPGVTIGKGAIIGAGAVVTKDIPDFAVAAGVPARVIRYRRKPPRK